MKTNNHLLVLFLLTFCFGFAQTTILCPIQQSGFKIENSDNIPSVTDNLDGTVTLTHSQQYITDIFANHVIYDFYQSSPSGSENAQKYYSILFKSKSLLRDLIESVPSDVFIFESYFTGIVNSNSTLLNTELVTFLDKKKFNLKKHCSIAPAEPSLNPCPNNINVPDDFNLKVEFNYDATNDLLLVESFGLTPCGSAFSIALKGGIYENTLQLWEVTPLSSSDTNTATFCEIENYVYTMFNISCSGNTFFMRPPIINYEDNTIILVKENASFGYDTLTFEEDVLSVNENYFENINLITSKTNPYIDFTGIEDFNYNIEIFSVLGEKIIAKTPYQKNSFSLNAFPTGLYFIKLSNSNNNYKTFKYIN